MLLLSPRLTSATADELLTAAAHQTNAEIELLLAQRFARADVPTLIRPLEAPCEGDELAVRRVDPSVASESPPLMEPVSAPMLAVPGTWLSGCRARS